MNKQYTHRTDHCCAHSGDLDRSISFLRGPSAVERERSEGSKVLLSWVGLPMAPAPAMTGEHVWGRVVVLVWGPLVVAPGVRALVVAVWLLLALGVAAAVVPWVVVEAVLAQATGALATAGP